MTRTPRPIDLATAQSRHLQRHGEILIVLPVRPQPNSNVTTILQDSSDNRRWYAKFWEYEWKSSYQPGDVVPIYSGKKPFKWVNWGDAVCVSVECRRVNSITAEEAKLAGVSVLPLQSEDDPSAWYETSPGKNQARTPIGSFAADWNRRHKRPGDAFDVDWGWFTVLKLDTKGTP